MEQEHEILKGLIWASAPTADERTCSALGDFAARCFKKIPEYGPASTKLGNACLAALGRVEGIFGVATIARVAAKVRYASARKQVDRVLGEAAKRAGITLEELAELSVPTHYLVSGKRSLAVGDYTAELSLHGTKAQLRWINEKGKSLSSVPKPIKEHHGDALKTLRKETKELAGMADAQALRLERLWFRPQPIAVDKLVQRYLEHPLVGLLASRLIWTLEDDGKRTAALWHGGRFLSLGEEVRVSSAAVARLWHNRNGVERRGARVA